MENLSILIQVIIGLGILNVWVVRPGIKSRWRGGSATNIREEFREYGLPDWFVPLVGGLKLSFAAMLILGIWFPVLVLPAALGIAALMLGAVIMHFRIRDPLAKSLPALSLLACALLIIAM